MRTEAAELAALEARYWHGFNDLQLHMRAHAEERGVLLRRVPPLTLTYPPASPHRCAARAALRAVEPVTGACLHCTVSPL